MENSSNTPSFRQLELLFGQEAPFIHLYTSPIENGLLVENDEERTAVLNLLALVAKELKTEVLAFALMSNHLHIVLHTDEAGGRVYFNLLHRRLIRVFSAYGKGAMAASIQVGITVITSLQQFRNEVAYVIRNPFVVREDINLLSYRWCSGYLYFNTFLNLSAGEPADEMYFRVRRKITRTSEGVIPKGLRADGLAILPQSFVNIKLVEKLYGSARQFLYCVMKNTEAQVELAKQYDEAPHLSDDDLFLVSRKLCREKYGAEKPESLPEKQKQEMAIVLHNRYGASNGQIARLITLPLQTVNLLFPLTAKK